MDRSQALGFALDRLTDRITNYGSEDHNGALTLDESNDIKAWSLAILALK